MKTYKFLPIITGLFTATLIISNILDVKLFTVLNIKLFDLDSFDMPAGVLLFPLAYIFGDLLTEVYGYSVSRKVIWTGFSALILFVIFSEIAIRLKPSDGWQLQTQFETVLKHIPRIVAASIIAYIMGEFTNSYTLAKLKIRTKGKGLAFRFVISTLIGQFVDTSVFIIIAYAGIFSSSILISLLISAWLFKVIWEIIALPLSVPFVKWMKKIENEDYYDENTNFNPFYLKNNK